MALATSSSLSNLTALRLQECFITTPSDRIVLWPRKPDPDSPTSLLALAALANHPSLTVLNVGGNDIGDEGARLLAEGGRGMKLRDLGVAHCGIGPSGARALLKHTGLTFLDISHNGIGDEGALSLLCHGSITGLGMNHCQLGPGAALVLAQNATLTELDVAYSELGETGVITLSRNTTLTQLRLNLGATVIGPDGMRVLKANTTLTHVAFEARKKPGDGAGERDAGGRPAQPASCAAEVQRRPQPPHHTGTGRQEGAVQVAPAAQGDAAGDHPAALPVLLRRRG